MNLRNKTLPPFVHGKMGNIDYIVTNTCNNGFKTTTKTLKKQSTLNAWIEYKEEKYLYESV